MIGITGRAWLIQLVFLLHQIGVRCVQITDLRVPSLVKNGTSAHALLDCEFSLSQEESGPNSGLVVKWFFNDSPNPVYQWIPGKHPQDLEMLKGRLNLDYKASGHKSTMHRALYINQPTTELSGNYKCVVSTFDDEDFMNKKMTVYASPARFEILQSRHDADTINITCVAGGVFPEPKISLWKHPGTVNRTKVHAYTETAFRNGAYDISASVAVPEAEFSGPITFSCDLKIVAISKNFTIKTTFRPGSAMLTNYGELTVRGTGSQFVSSNALLLLSILVLRIVSSGHLSQSCPSLHS